MPLLRQEKNERTQRLRLLFFTNLNAFNFELFNEALKNNGIEVAYISYYPQNTISFSNAGRASGRKIYIKYKDLQTAHEIYDAIFDKKS